MSFVAGILPAVRKIRGIPGQLGLRHYSVSITIRANSGLYGLRGSSTDTTLQIQEGNGQNPKVVAVTEDVIAMGQAPAGSFTVSPVSPDLGGGYTLAELVGKEANEKNLVFYTLTGPDFPSGRKFQLIRYDSSSALHWTLTLGPTAP